MIWLARARRVRAKAAIEAYASGVRCCLVSECRRATIIAAIWALLRVDAGVAPTHLSALAWHRPACWIAGDMRAATESVRVGLGAARELELECE